MKTIFSKGADFVLKRLEENKEEAYIVGGSVRDLLMGRTPNDFDVTTSCSYQRLREIFSDCRVVTLGEKYGTLGILYGDELIETTTYRADGSYLDGRHPENVIFTRYLEEDLKRRDFTINAMAMDYRKNLVDIFGGQEDLKNKLIKTVGVPEERFSEDKLRILRAIRFATNLGFEVETQTLVGIKKYAKDINLVSKERIREEFNKVLLSTCPSKGLNLMLKTGLLGEIIPEIIPTVGYDQMSPYHHKDLFKHILCVLDGVDKKLHLRLASLFHDIGKVETLSIDEKGVGHFYGHDSLGSQMAEVILKRLKYDNKTISKVKILIEKHMQAQPQIGDKGLKRLINKVGPDLIFDLFDLMLADLRCTRDDRDPSFLLNRKERVRELLANKTVVDKSGLVITGRDLLEIGYKEGKALGDFLDYLTDLVLEDESLNTKDILLKIAKEKLTEEI